VPPGRQVLRAPADAARTAGVDAGRAAARAPVRLQTAAPAVLSRTPHVPLAGATLAEAIGADLVHGDDGRATVAFPPLSAPGGAPAPGPFVARWPEPDVADAPAMPAPVAAPPPVPGASPAPAPPAAIDVEQLTEDVLTRLRDQLEFDHERRNGRFF